MDLQVGEAIERCRKGDIDALEPIYRQYRDLVFRICYRMAGNSAQAADWTQEIFIHVFEKIRSYRGNAKFSTWLYRVATNYCLDQLKTTRETVSLESLAERAANDDPGERILSEERHSAVWNALRSLNPKLRGVLVLKDLEELSYAEISRILEIPEGTVASRLNQARKELTDKLKNYSAMK